MKLNDVITHLVSLPHEFNRLGNISFHELLNESGYLNFSEEILVENIREALIEQPQRIDEWAQYSEDKRSSSGWYFRAESEGAYVVGYYPDSREKNTRSPFEDRATACAAFIKHEVEDIRRIS